MKAFAVLTAVVLAAIGIGVGLVGGLPRITPAITVPSMIVPVVRPSPPITTAAEACAYIVRGPRPGFFTDIEDIYVVWTTHGLEERYDDYQDGASPGANVWVVDVHAKRINWNHSVPARVKEKPSTDFVVSIYPKTGFIPGAAEGDGSITDAPYWKPLVFEASCQQRR